MPEEGIPDLGHDKILRYEELEAIVRASVELGIHKFRLTGGEPLVRKGIVDFVGRLKSIPGVKELTLTTNGALLGALAKPLKAAGLDRVNISLDSLNHQRFKEITRCGDLEDVLAGIEAAKKAGFSTIKLNVVTMKGFNDHEIMDFVQLTKEEPFEVRFIELMPFNGNRDIDYGYISSEEIMAKIPGLTAVEGSHSDSGVAQLYSLPASKGYIGFISPLSHCFCPNCNKVRITSDGKLKTCLHSNNEYDLKPALIEKTNGDFDIKKIKAFIEDAIMTKEECHHLEPGKATVERNMNKIGG
jgi:cyclic pyranopterin phosphate synthase